MIRVEGVNSISLEPIKKRKGKIIEERMGDTKLRPKQLSMFAIPKHMNDGFKELHAQRVASVKSETS